VYVNLKSCANLLNFATLLPSKYEAHFDCFSPDKYRSVSDLCFVAIGRKDKLDYKAVTHVVLLICLSLAFLSCVK